MYKLLLADDEPSIREGMRDLIHWEDLGFELVGIMDDGAPVIEYLRTNRVDVVISDIKMTTASGIDIAKFIFESGMRTKIIFISGYKEVDLAMSAIRYNVDQYILKPIDLAELEAHLQKIKEQLDEQHRQRVDLFDLEYYKRNLSELKDEYFLELAMGSFTNEKYLVSIFQLIYPHLDYRACPCFLLTVQMRDYNEFISRQWKHINGELYGTLQNCISSLSDQAEYRMIFKSGDQMRLLGIVQDPEGQDAQTAAERAGRRLCRKLNEIFYFGAVVSEVQVYSDIIGLSQSRSVSRVGSGDVAVKLREQEKMLYSALNTQNAEKLNNVLATLEGYLHELPFATARKAACDMLTTFRAKLAEESAALPAEALGEAALAQVRAATDMEQLSDAMRGVFRRALEVPSENAEDLLIERAKRYIIDNITEEISLENIADHFYLSQYYFSRTFKRKTGETLIDFIITQKMEKAKELLREPNYKVYEISSMVGYRSIRYFTKVFKNHTGKTPSDYRTHYILGIGGDGVE